MECCRNSSCHWRTKKINTFSNHRSKLSLNTVCSFTYRPFHQMNGWMIKNPNSFLCCVLHPPAQPHFHSLFSLLATFKKPPGSLLTCHLHRAYRVLELACVTGSRTCLCLLEAITSLSQTVNTSRMQERRHLGRIFKGWYFSKYLYWFQLPASFPLHRLV